ncbi:MAG: tryptophan synthase subunit alpha [Actinomycetota bacterium]
MSISHAPAAAERRTRLERHLRERLETGRKLFVPYLTAGLPSPQDFVDLVAEISEVADAIEVGLPFSDPIMDGPVIQEASGRALAAGVSVDAALGLIEPASSRAAVPLLAMTYYNPVHRMGAAAFAARLAGAGGAGAIVPDLPYEESGELSGALAGRELAFIQLVAPTTAPERAARLARASTGFVYAVSRLGVTGVREALEAAAREVVERVRPHSRLPVLLGIGISTAEQAQQAAEVADGVIVGSAMMRHVLAGDLAGAVELARRMRAALGRGAVGGMG